MKVAFISFFLFVWHQGCLGASDQAIHTAALLGKLDEVKSLVEEKKVDVNLKGDDDKTPLMKAAYTPAKPLVQERLSVVKYLIEKGADVNAVDKNGGTALLYAVWNKEPGNLAIVKYLIEKGADVKANAGGKTSSLHRAAYFGQLEMVKLLIEKGADVNALDANKNTPLVEAADSKSLETVKYLVEKGAKLRPEDHNSLLRRPLYNNNVEMFKYFISIGVPVTTANSDKETPLHAAAEFYKDSLEPVQILVEKGADVNAVDKKGRTPAHNAAKRGNWQVLEYLGDNTKANMYAEDNDKKTPFVYATENWSGHARDYLESWKRKQTSQKTA